MQAKRSAWVLLEAVKPLAFTAAHSSALRRNSLLSQLGPELYHTLRISASDVVDIAFEVGSLGNIHGRRTRHKGMCRIANAIAAAAEEFIEDIVFIGSYDQTSHREPHLLGDPAAKTSPKLPEGTENVTSSSSDSVAWSQALK